MGAVNELLLIKYWYLKEMLGISYSPLVQTEHVFLHQMHPKVAIFL